MFKDKILLLIPHPDDEVVGCGASVRRAVARGCRVLGAYLTDGVPAKEVMWFWQRAGRADKISQRWCEAGLAAEALGHERIYARDIPTRTLKQHLKSVAEDLQNLLAEFRPDIIWTPAYEGGHQDHDVANFLASTLADQVEVWEFSEYNYCGGRVCCNRFPALTGAEVKIDLTTAERGRKEEILRLYASEKGNLGYVTTTQEMFRPLAEYDYSCPPHAGKTFYQRFQWVPGHPRIDYCRPEEVCLTLAEYGQTQDVSEAPDLRRTA